MECEWSTEWVNEGGIANDEAIPGRVSRILACKRPTYLVSPDRRVDIK